MRIYYHYSCIHSLIDLCRFIPLSSTIYINNSTYFIMKYQIELFLRKVTNQKKIN